MIMRATRLTASALGLAVLGWQGWNAYQGKFVHFFLAADIVVALLLVAASLWPAERPAAAAMLAAFSALAAVFFSATSGRLLMGGYADPGTILTTLGVAPCVVGAVVLGCRLAKEGRSLS
jgi:hypothetical protein